MKNKIKCFLKTFALGLVHETKNLYNCKIYDSYIIGRHTISGFSKTITGEVKNCVFKKNM